MAPRSQIDLTRLDAKNVGRATRLLKEARAATLSGRAPRIVPRPVIGESWGRMIQGGMDPERDPRSGLLSPEDIEQRRRGSRLAQVLPVLRENLAAVADAAEHIMVVCDAEGRVLWREGHKPVLRDADDIGLAAGADYAESVVGTNGIGTPLVVRRPVQVVSAEHFVRGLHSWICAGAPITDPRDGTLLGVVDISGPLSSLHPAMLALVGSVAKLAEARLREGHMAALDRLRSLSAPMLARIGGRAIAVDTQGWTAGVTGMPPVDRLSLPKSFGAGHTLLPSLGPCAVEPLPGGWLIRADTRRASAVEPLGVTRVTLDVSSPRNWWVTVAGAAGEWTHELSPRHAELLYLLAAHRCGRSASQLASDMFGDPARTVTVRAELSRIRRYLGGLLEHRPYRFREDTQVDVVRPARATDLLPHSLARTVAHVRATET